MPQSECFPIPKSQTQNGCLHCSFYPPPGTKNQGSRRRNHLHVPADLIYAILSRLPTKSLIRFRCVSKTWNSFIHDPYFLQLRQSINLENNLFLFVCPNHPSEWRRSRNKSIHPHIFIGHVPIHEDGHLELNSSTRIFSSTDNLLYLHVDVQSVNGLLCFHPRRKAFRYYREEADITTYICNPTTGQVVILPWDNTIDYFSNFILLTHFGYDPLRDKFKVLRVILYYNYKHDLLFQELRILTVGDYVWRNVTHDISYDLRSNIDHLRYTGTCVNGAIHWLDFTHNVITVFDLGSEQFKEIPIFEFDELYLKHAHLNELGGYLSLVRYNMEMKLIELSILKDYENHVWIRERIILTDEIGISEGVYIPLCKVYTQEIMLLRCGNNNRLRVHYYDTKTRSCRRLFVKEIPNLFRRQFKLGEVQWFSYQENFTRL